MLCNVPCGVIPISARLHPTLHQCTDASSSWRGMTLLNLYEKTVSGHSPLLTYSCGSFFVYRTLVFGSNIQLTAFFDSGLFCSNRVPLHSSHKSLTPPSPLSPSLSLYTHTVLHDEEWGTGGDRRDRGRLSLLPHSGRTIKDNSRQTTRQTRATSPRHQRVRPQSMSPDMAPAGQR